MTEDTATELTLFSAAWRHRWLVVATTVVASALGIVYVTLNPSETVYTARASLVVQATAGGLDLGASASPQRFVANQVEILRSEAVSQLASQIAGQQDPPVVLSSEDIADVLQVQSSSISDLIDVVFTATADPALAVGGANAVVEAYKELVTSEKSAVTAAALERIDAQLVTLEEQSRKLATQIAGRVGQDTALADLRAEYDDAVVEIVLLQAEAKTADATRLGEIRTRLSDLRSLIAIYQSVKGIGRDDAELAELQGEQQQLSARRDALLERRDTISIDTELSPEVVAFSSPAQTAAPSPDSGSGRALAVALVVGLLAGTGTAYLLATRRNVFHDRAEPEAVLGVPLLAEIPDFSEEGLQTLLPVRDSPRSASAEAFRFAATSIELRLHKQGVKTLIVLSATLGAGKSTVLANTALAAARQGNRVLLIDADFGNQALTALLTGDEEWLPRGLTDVVGSDMALDDAISTLDIGSDAQLFLLTRGRQPVAAADLVKSPEVQRLFEAVHEQFDIVFVDAPPLLQVAYASTLASYGDAGMVVVEHKGSAAQLNEARTRLNLIGVPLLGYVYNRSPLRREMTSSEGSMADILGDRGMLDTDDEPAKPTSGTRWRR